MYIQCSNKSQQSYFSFRPSIFAAINLKMLDSILSWLYEHMYYVYAGSGVTIAVLWYYLLCRSDYMYEQEEIDVEMGVLDNGEPALPDAEERSATL